MKTSMTEATKKRGVIGVGLERMEGGIDASGNESFMGDSEESCWVLKRKRLTYVERDVG